MLKLKLLFFNWNSDIQFESVTHSRGRGSITYKMDNTLEINKSSNDLEKNTFIELDISHSPIKNTGKYLKNLKVFELIYDIFKKFYYGLCVLRVKMFLKRSNCIWAKDQKLNFS